jgi:NTP pyrophosphatase (non-canonical NTP hydrolase)
MTCESAEFAEAVRGKRGDKIEEAGDMLFVLMSWTESAGIPWREVVAATERKCLRLDNTPRYPGEQFETPNV